MTANRNPQAAQMADESMVRCLTAQAEAIWPQESALLDRYELPNTPAILDLACGTGEITRRLAAHYPGARVLGIDLQESLLARARAACAEFAERVRYEHGDAFALALGDDRFDLTVCRHLLQAIPTPERVLAEMARVTRPGGYLHVLAEDYTMIHFHPTSVDADAFFRDGPLNYARATGTDLTSGRKVFGWLSALGLEDIRIDYLTVDTLRVPAAVIRRIWVAWRDGYAEAIAEHTALSLAEVRQAWDAMIACLDDPRGYAVWHVPVATARVPAPASAPHQ